MLWFLSERKTKKETNLQNPEVLEAREVHFSDSCNVVSVQIPAGRNTQVLQVRFLIKFSLTDGMKLKMK